jgi:hypothetical protein
VEDYPIRVARDTLLVSKFDDNMIAFQSCGLINREKFLLHALCSLAFDHEQEIHLCHPKYCASCLVELASAYVHAAHLTRSFDAAPVHLILLGYAVSLTNPCSSSLPGNFRLAETISRINRHEF